MNKNKFQSRNNEIIKIISNLFVILLLKKRELFNSEIFFNKLSILYGAINF